GGAPARHRGVVRRGAPVVGLSRRDRVRAAARHPHRPSHRTVPARHRRATGVTRRGAIAEPLLMAAFVACLALAAWRGNVYGLSVLIIVAIHVIATAGLT